MPGFQWSLEHDLALCTEVCSARPGKSLAEWLSVADTLNKRFSTASKDIALKGRGCKKRIALLVKKFKAEDKRSLKRYTVVILWVKWITACQIGDWRGVHTITRAAARHRFLPGWLCQEGKREKVCWRGEEKGGQKKGRGYAKRSYE